MVNGEPFYQEDMSVYTSELRALVANHYGRRYNLNFMGADFWDTVFDDGLTPREFLNNWGLKDLSRNMVLIQQARLRGIDTPDTYSDLEIERINWNAPTDEIIYGPRTLGPAEYTSYRITGITNALKTELLSNELSPTDAQLRASYNELPQHFKRAPFTASGIRFFWTDGDPAVWERRAHVMEVSDSEKKHNEEVRIAIMNSIQQGLSAEIVVETLSNLYPDLKQAEFTLNSRNVSRVIEYDQELAIILEEPPPGSFVPGPFDMPSLYYITAKEGGGFYRFEEAPGLGRNKWINDKFEIFLAQKIKEARVTLFTDEDFIF